MVYRKGHELLPCPALFKQNLFLLQYYLRALLRRQDCLPLSWFLKGFLSIPQSSEEVPCHSLCHPYCLYHLLQVVLLDW